jgi:hypothetical protein
MLFCFWALTLQAEDWSPLQFLVGDWVGEGSGQPGQSSAGAFTLTPDLDGGVLARRSSADYPAANGRPAVHHSDLMVIYRDSSSKQIQATYWDNEGHVIPYLVQTASSRAVFTSEGANEGPRYRLTYEATGKDRVTIKFEIAEPGKDFAVYLEGAARRK